MTLEEKEAVVSNHKGATVKCPLAENMTIAEFTGKLSASRRLGSMLLVNFEEFPNFYVNVDVVYIEKEGRWVSLIEG